MTLETEIVRQEIHIMSEQMKRNLEKEIAKKLEEWQVEIARELTELLNKLNQ